MTAIAVGDAWLALLPQKPGWTIDDTLAKPSEFKPDRVYLYPRDTAPQRIADDPPGRFEGEAPLRLRIVVCASALGENRVLNRTRKTTETLDEWVDALHRMVRLHRAEPMWFDAFVENLNYQLVSNDKVRAAAVDVVVRLNTEDPAVFDGSGVGIGSGL